MTDTARPAPADPTAPPTVVQPQVVNLTMITKQVRTTAGEFVALEIYGPTGMAVYLLAPDDARTWGELLAKAGTRAKVGLVLPDGPVRVGP